MFKLHLPWCVHCAAADIARECITARDTFAVLGSSEYWRSGSWTACQIRSTYTPGSVVFLPFACFKSAIVVTLLLSRAVMLLCCYGVMTKAMMQSVVPKCIWFQQWIIVINLQKALLPISILGTGYSLQGIAWPSLWNPCILYWNESARSHWW